MGGSLRYVAPTTTYDGMPVFAPYRSKGRIGLVPCKVMIALGDLAFCNSAEPPVNRWFRLDELRVPVQANKP